jgi:hypothetical protein
MYASTDSPLTFSSIIIIRGIATDASQEEEKEKKRFDQRQPKFKGWHLLPSGDQQSVALLRPQTLTSWLSNADSYWQRGNQKPNKSAFFPFICALHLDVSFSAGL